MKISEKYRAKALACEKLGRDARDFDIQSAWAEIAIEWHALANRVAQRLRNRLTTRRSSLGLTSQRVKKSAQNALISVAR
jgi:hypothetical protein